MARINICMPSLEEGLLEAPAIKLLKNVGDPVEKDEAIVIIAADDIDTEIVAPIKGVIEDIRVKPGEIVKVGDIVVVLSTLKLGEENAPSLEGPVGEESFLLNKKPEDQDSESIEEVAIEEPYPTNKDIHKGIESPIQEAVSHSENPPKRFLSLPVKMIMKREDIDINEVAKLKGSGYRGRLTKKDILQYAKFKRKGIFKDTYTKKIPSSSEISRKESAEEKSFKYAFTKRQDSSESEYLDIASEDILTENYIEKDVDKKRMALVQKNIDSKNKKPGSTYFIEVDVSNFKKIKDTKKEAYLRDYGVRLTYTPLFMAATAKALKKFPEFNAHLLRKKIRYYNIINIGFTTFRPNGLPIVPVVKDVENLELREIALAIKVLSDKLINDDIGHTDEWGGTFSITNYGSSGTVIGIPVIEKSQTAILGIGEIKKKVIVIENRSGDRTAIRPMCLLTLSFDLRVIDDILAADFLTYLKDCIENFNL